MIKRRNFLKQSGTVALGSLFLTKPGMAFFEPPMAKPVGLQLFTLFNVIDNDVRGSLQKVANLGFKEIESESWSEFVHQRKHVDQGYIPVLKYGHEDSSFKSWFW